MATEAMDTTARADRGWSVVVTYRARAALYQLTHAEQQAVHDMLDGIARDGWDMQRPSYLSVMTRHDAHGPYYGIRLRQTPCGRRPTSKFSRAFRRIGPPR